MRSTLTVSGQVMQDESVDDILYGAAAWTDMHRGSLGCFRRASC